MNKLLIAAAAIAACALGSTAHAQDAEQEPQIRHSATEKRSDRAAGLMRVVIPARKDLGIGMGSPVPTPEHDPALPRMEEVPEIEPEARPPMFFGEPVTGNFILVLDRSGSMGSQDLAGCPVFDENGNVISNPSRIQAVQTEATKLINALTEENEFAIVTFGGSTNGGGRAAPAAAEPATRGCGPYRPRPRPVVVDGPESTDQGRVDAYGARVNGTTGNKQQGARVVGAMRASGPTPLYRALNTACTRFGTDIDKLFVLTDGRPNVTGNSGAILRDFPGWFSDMRQFGCQIVCMHIGNDNSGTEFLQSLAGIGGGKYVKV